MRTRFNRLPAVMMAALLGAAFSACSSGQESRSGALDISPAASEAAPGDVVKFQAAQGSSALAVAWAVQEQQGGTIDAAGNYTAPDAEGTYHIVATARASAAAASAEVRVRQRSTSGVSLSPHTATIAAGASVAFTVQLTAPVSGGVTWSVEEGSAGGTISADGVYAAPETGGTFHVLATSAADPTKMDRATLTVIAPTPEIGAAPGNPPVRTTPPADGTTAWAPSPADADWVNLQSFGAVGDAVTDDTAAFRSAAATGKKLFVPKPPVAYKLTGFITIQNSVYGDGSMPLIRMYGADGDPDQGHTHNIFYISGYQGPGLVINGLHLDGQWDGGANAEYSMGVNIASSSNVTIQNCNIERAYGDDVFVSAFAEPMSKNIVIQNNTLGSPRRCNVAINGAVNVTIKNNVINKTGTYVTAVDLEPDPLGFQYVRGVTIDNNVFNVAAQEYYAGAISVNNPDGNPSSGDVSITNNRGIWTPTAAYMDIIPGSGGLVGIVPHLPWYNVTASNNTR